MERIFLLLVLFSTAQNLSASRRFEFTPGALDAYEKVTSLRFDDARLILQQIRKSDPDNLVVYHLENYIDFFTVFINEDEREYQQLKKNRDKRLEAIKAGDPNSPYYLYTQADIRLQWALARLKFEEYVGAFMEVSKAYRLLKKNAELFPDFMPNRKDLAILHAMVGTIPDNYKWGVRLLGGLDGTIAQGRKELEEVLRYADRYDFIFETESRVLYAYLLLHLENKGEEAWTVIRQTRLQPSQNPIHCFLMANVAMRTNRNDTAIDILEKRPGNKDFLSFPHLDLMLGLAKLRRLDPTARYAFQRYLANYPGRNFIKETYQKMAWCSLLEDDPEGYRANMQKCLSNGKMVTGGDKNALQEARSGSPPNIDLLKARLLFDGGYFYRAGQLLQEKKPADFPAESHRLEYFYRMGRLFHGMKKYSEALRYYQQTIQQGRDLPYFFACNAALQSGLIYEETGQPEKARTSFQLCLSIYPEEYQTSLHQKAKAGLVRLADRR